VTEKSEAIALARRCLSSRLTGWWTRKNNRKKWRAEDEKRRKGLLTLKTMSKNIHAFTHESVGASLVYHNHVNWRPFCKKLDKNSFDSMDPCIQNGSHDPAAIVVNVLIKRRKGWGGSSVSFEKMPLIPNFLAETN
jgi:hypothetical protein